MHKIGATIRDSSKTITGAYLTEHFCKFLKAWNKLAVKCNLLKEWKFYLRVAKFEAITCYFKSKIQTVYIWRSNRKKWNDFRRSIYQRLAIPYLEITKLLPRYPCFSSKTFFESLLFIVRILLSNNTILNVQLKNTVYFKLRIPNVPEKLILVYKLIYAC